MSNCQRASRVYRRHLAIRQWLFAALVGGASLLWTYSAGNDARAADEPSAAEATAAQAQTESKATEGAGHPNPLEFRTDLALWTFVVFVVLLLVLKKFAWG